MLEVYFFLLLNHPSADLKSLVLIFMVITKQIIWVRKLLSAFKILKHAGVLAKRSDLFILQGVRHAELKTLIAKRRFFCMLRNTRSKLTCIAIYHALN